MLFGGESAESYYDEGITAAVRGDLKRAVDCFERAVQIDREFVAAYHQLGRCQLRMGDGERAAQTLRSVVERRPGLIPPRLDLGCALLATGKIEEARHQFLQVDGMDISNVRAHLGLAQVCFDSSDWAGAVEHADMAVNLSASNLAAHMLRGRAAILAGDVVGGETTLRQVDSMLAGAIEANPEQPENYYLRGEASFARGRFSDALEHYKSAERRAQGNRLYSVFSYNFTLADILVKQAQCWAHMDNPKEARLLAERALQLDPTNRSAQAFIKEGG